MIIKAATTHNKNGRWELSLKYLFNQGVAEIALYPFTTLSQTVDKICFLEDLEMTLADIPGWLMDCMKIKDLDMIS